MALYLNRYGTCQGDRMTVRIGALLNKLVPEDLAIKGLSKIDPRIKKFFANSVSSGLGATAALNFLRNKFENPTIEAEKSRLKEGVKAGTLRPDERASYQEMRENDLRGNTLKQVATTSAALAGGPVVASLANMIPKGKSSEESKSTNVGQPENIIAEYFPELHQFIVGHLNQGRSHEEAGALAQAQQKFQSPIKKLEKDTGSRFSQILRQVYAGSPSQSQTTIQPQQSQSGGSGQRVQQMQQILQALQGLRRPNG